MSEVTAAQWTKLFELRIAHQEALAKLLPGLDSSFEKVRATREALRLALLEAFGSEFIR